jgi:hypothetical protein
MPATDPALQERLDLLARRSQLSLEPGQLVSVLEILTVSGDHLTGALEQLIAESARSAVTLGG